MRTAKWIASLAAGAIVAVSAVADNLNIKPGAEILASSYGDKTSGTLNSIITAWGSNRWVRLVVDGGAWSVTNSVTFPTNFVVNVLPGSYFNISTTKVVTVNGPFEAGFYNCFQGSGTAAGSADFMYRLTEWGSSVNYNIGTGRIEANVGMTNANHTAGTNFAKSVASRIYTLTYPTNVSYFANDSGYLLPAATNQFSTLNTATGSIQTQVSAITNRTITAGTALSGGGNLSANRTLSLNLAYTDARYYQKYTNIFDELVVADRDLLGSELTTNGTFANTNGWVFSGSATYNSTSKRVEITSGNTGTVIPSTDLAIEFGKVYEISIYKGTGAATNVISLGGSSWTTTGSGTNTWYCPCRNESTNLVIQFNAGASSDWFDNISIKACTNGSAFVTKDLFVGGDLYVSGKIYLGSTNVYIQAVSTTNVLVHSDTSDDLLQ